MALQPTGSTTPPTAADPAADPSMEDILASIRRILNEDEAPKPASDPHEPGHTPDSGVLVLDSSMMVPEPPRDAPPRDTPPRDTSSRDVPPLRSDVSQPMSSAERPANLEHPLPEPEPAAPRAPPPQLPAPTPAAPSTPASPSNSLLVAPEAAAAAGASVDALRRTLASERGPARRADGRGSGAGRAASAAEGMARQPPAAFGRAPGAGGDRARRRAHGTLSARRLPGAAPPG